MFRPTHCYVSFKPVEVSKLSRGGIELPNQTKHALVTAVGPGKVLPSGTFRECCVKPGDYIVLMSNAFIQEVMVSGELTYIVDDQFISGTIDESDVIGKVPTIVTPEEPRIVGVN